MFTISRIVRPAAIALAFALTGAASEALADKPVSTDILRAALQADRSEEVLIREVKFPPGFDSPRHFHTGDVFVYVISGEGQIAIDGEARMVRTGEVLQEAADDVMIMSNSSDTDWLHFVVFQVGPEGAPMSKKAE